MGTHGPGGWGPQGIPLTGGGGLRVPNLRVREHPLTSGVAHEREEWRIDVLPWYRPVGVAIPPVSRKGGRTGNTARVSGRHVVRGTDRPHLSWKCAQVTGKAGQKRSTFRWDGRQLTTLKALASDLRVIKGGDRPRRRLRGRYRLGHRPVVLLRETAQCTVSPA